MKLDITTHPIIVVEKVGEEHFNSTRLKNYVSALINVTPAKTPDTMMRVFIEKMRRLRRMYKKNVIKLGGYKDALYQYDNISAKDYYTTPLLSTMRGTVIRFYENGEARVCAFPFAKFFNRGEVPDAIYNGFSSTLVTHKLDGTLIICWRDVDTGELRFNTRGVHDWQKVTKGKTGFYTEVTVGKISNPYVVAFVNTVKRMKLWYELESLVKDNVTVMFELCHKIPASVQPDITSILNDKSWTPYVLAVRQNTYPYKLEYLIGRTAFPEPQVYEIDSENRLLEMIEKWRDREGVVVWKPDEIYRRELGFTWWNKLVKYKSAKYVLATEVGLLSEDRILWRRLARAVIVGLHDDLLAITTSEEVREFIEAVLERYMTLRESWGTLVELVRDREKPRKLDEKAVRILKSNLKMGWMLRNLAEAVDKDRIEGTLRNLAIKSLPRDKDKIISFMERLNKKINEAIKTLS